MKLYIAAIEVTKEEKETIVGLQSPKSILDWKYNRNTDTWRAIYGWSQDKKMMKAFKSSRNPKMFSYTKISENQKVSFILDRYMDLKVERYKLKGAKGNLHSVIMSWFEYIVATDAEFLSSTILFNELNYFIDPMLFSKEALKILEQFGYSSIFFNYFADGLPFKDCPLEDVSEKVSTKCHVPDILTRQDDFYGVSSYVTNHQFNNEVGIPSRFAKLNELHCFIQTFRELLKK